MEPEKFQLPDTCSIPEANKLPEYTAHVFYHDKTTVSVKMHMTGHKNSCCLPMY